MMSLFQTTLRNLGVVIVVLIGLSLILVSIFGPNVAERAGLSAPGVSSVREADPNPDGPDHPEPPDKEGDVPDDVPGTVRNFVLFTSVPYGSLHVVTGIRFASNHSAKITEQWCYVDQKGADGGASVRLSLARANAAGTITYSPYSEAALKTFNLTRSKAAALVTSHCRFKTSPNPKKA